MSKLVEQTIVKTVEEMIVVDGDMNWIREEVEYMFKHSYDVLSLDRYRKLNDDD
jgi:hypothetical protein